MTDRTVNNCLQNILVGINIGPVDDTLFPYVGALVEKAGTTSISFLHVMPKLWNIKKGWDINHTELITQHRDFKQSLKDNILSNILKYHIDLDPNAINVAIKEGNPLEELLHYAGEVRPTTILIGQKKEGREHGLLGKNILKNADQNALVVPQGTEFGIQKILVPMDFSEYAKTALDHALKMRDMVSNPVEITMLHVFDVPNMHKRISNTLAEYAQYLKQSIEEEFNELMQQYASDEMKNVDYMLLQIERNSIGSNIMQFARQQQYDMIIMGAKGHSAINRILMGSVTERVLMNELCCPVMVIKNITT